METGWLKVMLLAAGIAGVPLAAGSVMLDALAEAADAARRAQLKTLWAVVNSDGTLARGKGVASISKPATGEYEVKFKRDVSGCAYSATFDNTRGFIFISLREPDIGTREGGRNHQLERMEECSSSRASRHARVVKSRVGGGNISSGSGAYLERRCADETERLSPLMAEMLASEGPKRPEHAEMPTSYTCLRTTFSRRVRFGIR